MDKTVLIAGGTGLIGTRLSAMLLEKGYTVRLLTRKPVNTGEFYWDPQHGKIDEAALRHVDFVINLAGAGIADKRWTSARKKEIVESRVKSAQLLARVFSKMDQKPAVYLSASAIGFYGNTGEKLVVETDSPADNGFLATCCRQWEAAADTIATLGIRTVKIRVGVVLSREGGALAEIIKPLQWGLGAYFGNGRAWWSWIHRDDVCRIFLWAMENQEAAGVYNAVAPTPERGIDLVHATAKAMHQIAVFLPVPAFALRLALGEMAAVVLNSNRVSAEKIEAKGFRFLYPRLQEAMQEIFSKR